MVQPCTLTHSAVQRCLFGERREKLVPSPQRRRGTLELWLNLFITFALGKETLCLVVGESDKSLGETLGGLQGSEY